MALIQKTVYIREEDIEAWEKVPNKAEFLHNALNGVLLSIDDGKPWEPAAPHKTGELIDATIKKLYRASQNQPPDKPTEGQKLVSQALRRPDIKYCKHGYAVGNCKHGCKK